MVTDMSIGSKDGVEIIVSDEALMSSERFPPHLYGITLWEKDFAAFRSRTEPKLYIHPELFKQHVTFTKD